MLHKLSISSILQVILQGRIQVVWETGKPVWASKLWRPNNTFQVLFFQLYFNKKIVEVAKNGDRRENHKGKKTSKQKKKLSMKVFSLFKYVIDHKNVRCFFLISLQTCSKSLNGINSLHYINVIVRSCHWSPKQLTNSFTLLHLGNE